MWCLTVIFNISSRFCSIVTTIFFQLSLYGLLFHSDLHSSLQACPSVARNV